MKLKWIAAASVAALAVACSSGAVTEEPKVSGTQAAASATAATTASKAASTTLKPNADRIVSIDWLAGKTSDASVVALDLRAKDKYEAGHIPGAVWIATADFNQKKGDITELAPADQIAAALGKAGIRPEDTIVLYDDQGSLWSTRVAWSLDVYGHKDSRVLNGTWTAWAAANKPTSKDASTRAATQYAFAGAPNTSIVVNMDQMVKAVGDPSKVVCDSRTADEFTGRDLRAPATNGGHVPGALNVAYSDAVGKSGEFLPVEELRKLYDSAGIKAADGQTIFTYCQSGIRAAHAWFVLKHLIGYQSVAVYDGSWEEWGARSDTKIEGARS
ncbi:MAG: sulfurtransferase [Dehalococcoidia bacterium]|nr:sulfurtransferase [Dehalococcoidia bacterium]